VDSNGLVSNTRIQEDYVKRNTTFKSIARPSGVDLKWAHPGETEKITFDVVSKENNNDSSKQVLGRFIITNYRIKFIENGKRENPPEKFDSNSIPFGCIKLVV
jgi:hypothetical protein